MGHMISSPEEEAMPAEEAEPKLAPITLSACTLGGKTALAEISPSESVLRLKEFFAPQLEEALDPWRLKLGLGSTVLHDKAVLADYEILDKTELAAFIIPPAPAWAEKLGFSGEHPSILREYYTTYGMNMKEEWATDDGVWQAMAEARQRVSESQKNHLNWNSDIQLVKDGKPASMLRAAPGEKFSVVVLGHIWNKNGDSCIHQLMLVMDKVIIASLSDSVPARGSSINKTVQVLAPPKPGTYLLWKKSDLQYSMSDARANCQREIARLEDARMPDKYPGGFVGWLIVE